MADDNNYFCVKVWDGDYCLPSLDPQCLAVITYCKFSAIQLEVIKSGNPLFSPSGSFPVFQHKDVTLTSLRDICTFLRQINCGCDAMLSTRDNANVIAFSSMIEEKLLPAILQVWWGDEKNFVDITRPFYAHASRFPLNFWLPGAMQRAAVESIRTRVHADVGVDQLENMVYKEAMNCIDHLSHKLADLNYFFGKNPSSVDALVFGYIAPLLELPLTNNNFINHVRSCDNLCKLVAHIRQLFFPKPASTHTYPRYDPPKDTPGVVDLDYPHKKRNMVLAALFAITTMMTYAFMSGIIQITLDDDGDDDTTAAAGDVTKGQQREQYNHVGDDNEEI